MTKTLSRPVNKSKGVSGSNSQAGADVKDMSLEELESILGDATDIQRQISGIRFNREAKLAACIQIFKLLKIYADPNAKPDVWIPKMVMEMKKLGLGDKLETHGPDMNKHFWYIINTRRMWMKTYIETKKEKASRE